MNVQYLECTGRQRDQRAYEVCPGVMRGRHSTHWPLINFYHSSRCSAGVVVLMHFISWSPVKLENSAGFPCGNEGPEGRRTSRLNYVEDLVTSQCVRWGRFGHNSAWQEVGLVEVNFFLVPAWQGDWDRRLIASARGLDSGTCQWMVWLGSWDQKPASNRLEPLRREIRCTELAPNLSVIKVGVFICCPWRAFMSVPVEGSWVENAEIPSLTSQ